MLTLCNILLQNFLSFFEFFFGMLPVAHDVKVKGSAVLRSEVHTEGVNHIFELFIRLEQGCDLELAREGLLSQLVSLHTIFHFLDFFVFIGHVD